MNFASVFLHVRTAIEFTDGIAESIFHGVEPCIFHIFLLCFSYNICNDLDLQRPFVSISAMCEAASGVAGVAQWF